MSETVEARHGMVTAPHRLAAEAGLRILKEGGNAIEAMVAAAATISVVYPHMNAIGGDCVWLIHAPGAEPVGIDACGAAAAGASIAHYSGLGFDRIPARGGPAALTVAGALSGWQMALTHSRARWGGKLPLSVLLEDAIGQARAGFPATTSQTGNTLRTQNELAGIAGFAEVFLPDGRAPSTGDTFRQPRLAETFERLARAGLDDFYRGELARSIARDLAEAGSPLTLSDLERYQARSVAPLGLALRGHRIFNMPPPTQGLASLLVLGLYDRLDVPAAEGFDFVHGIVEATKQAFAVRDAHVTDPAYMTVDPGSFLAPTALDQMASRLDRHQAAPWPRTAKRGDTVWLGAADAQGRMVSFIQSLYWDFGSGLVLPGTGITWQNRGVSFSLDQRHLNALAPGRRPFHTIQPALARLSDGRVMVYGTMGGDGQPQTQAILFARHVLYGQSLQGAIDAPRWLLGRTWGAEKSALRIESRFEPPLIDRLKAAGHEVAVLGPYEEIMGHAGALVRRSTGALEGACDPRSDGGVAGC